MSHGCLKKVSQVLHGQVKDVSILWKLQGMLQDVEMEVSKMFHDYFKGSSMNVQGCLRKVILMSNPTAVEVELS